ncbi:MAG: hypothetical protein KAS32_16825, partial [Candidatus Peribacteraceae bacterium]|nr:hypothetical protein [Candidatus Peribacteraceae bacterium]
MIKNLLIGLLLIPNLVFAADYWVDEGGDGSDNTACTGCPCATAYDEIVTVASGNDLDPGDTVHVCGGEYTSQVNVGTNDVGTAALPVTWQCEVGETCTVNVTDAMQWRVQDLVGQVIDGFTFTGESTNNYKIRVVRSIDITIKNSSFSGGTGDAGVILDQQDTTANERVTIDNNSFNSNANCITVNFATYNVVTDTADLRNTTVIDNIATCAGQFIGTVYGSVTTSLAANHTASGWYIAGNEVDGTDGAGINTYFYNEGSLTNYIGWNDLRNIGDGTSNVNAYNVHYARDLVVEHNVCDTVDGDTSDSSCYILDYGDTNHTYVSDGVIIRYNVAKNCNDQNYSSGFLAWSGKNSTFHNNYSYNCSVGYRNSNTESTGNVFYENTAVHSFKSDNSTGNSMRISDP